MPRRPSKTVTLHLPDPSPSTTPVVSNLQQLRRQWKWAAFSHFFHIFRALFSSSEVTLVDIENDLSRSTNVVLPNIIQRLLYTLTLDRKVSLNNWQTVLRKQYLKRDPESNPFVSDPSIPPGPTTATFQITVPPTSATTPDAVDSEKSIDENGLQNLNDEQDMAEEGGFKNWCELPMLVKLDSMYLLTEWQFQNPLRLRSIMKDDDEAACWRTEPIGKDGQNNSYWFIGGDRLWIQRPLQDTRNTSRKRRKNDRIGLTSQKIARKPIPNDRRLPMRAKEAAGNADFSTRSPGASKATDRGTRLAKARANVKLDSKKNGFPSQKQGTHDVYRKHEKPPTGTRVSARLRADIAKDGWQSVPREWLTEGTITPGIPKNLSGSAGAGEKAHYDLDSVSDLTELSSDDENTDCIKSGTAPESSLNDRKAEVASGRSEHPQNDVVEWETICVTRYDWENFAKRFENATHTSERKLHKVLDNDIAPVVIEGLKDIERRHRLEEALVYRKRSSRIAIKESEKEKAREIAKSRADQQARINRALQLQARLHIADTTRESRVLTREQKRREREDTEVYVDGHVDVVCEAPSESSRSQSKFKREAKQTASIKMSRNPSPEIWELDCEICKESGVNQDDGTPMMSCGICSKWQHILCHDDADTLAGRPRRNWQNEDFVCQRCRVENHPMQHVGSNQGPRESFTSPPPTSLQNAVKPNNPIPHMTNNSFFPGDLTSRMTNVHEERPHRLLASNGSFDGTKPIFRQYAGNHNAITR